ncbi:MAG: sodium ion-translocating decarboxylase subunit beta [Deltaproteobacteria bacterium]|nr:sodium ion-translocating decarboxylase subunit beta [Deltaproteobacteria bacterium]
MAGILDNIINHASGLAGLGWRDILMWVIASSFLYLGIRKRVEPLLLVPIGFSALLVNLPAAGLTVAHHGLLWFFYHYGLETEIAPSIIFLGLGALTDFGPLLAAPRTLLLGAAAQFGVYAAMFGALILGFTPAEACSIGIIGGADGPTTIYTTVHLAPHLLGATALAAYSYMALVPIIQPPIIRLMVNKEERGRVMKQLRKVPKIEKVLFPILMTVIVGILVPAAVPLIGMLALGNLFRESGVVPRLYDVSQNALMNIVTIILGLGVGSTMEARLFLQTKVLEVYFLGLGAFIFSTFGGILFAKFLNLFLKEKINPIIGAAGVSAVPMAARVAQVEGQKANPKNYLLMHAMGPNVAGVIGTIVAAGVFITMLG